MTYDLALTALADPRRRSVFEALRAGPKAVGVIARDLGISQPAVSQHLAVLRGARLVRSRAQGTRRLYEPEAAGLAAVRSYFDAFWGDVLEAYAQSFTESDQ